MGILTHYTKSEKFTRNPHSFSKFTASGTIKLDMAMRADFSAKKFTALSVCIAKWPNSKALTWRFMVLCSRQL